MRGENKRWKKREKEELRTEGQRERDRERERERERRGVMTDISNKKIDKVRLTI